MSVGREEIRSLASAWLVVQDGSTGDDLARHCLALLAELEQAEKERDETKHQRDNFERIAREQAENKRALWLWRNENEARLAKVPALVEAMEQAVNRFEAYTAEDVRDKYHGAASEALTWLNEALAAWETNA